MSNRSSGVRRMTRRTHKPSHEAAVRPTMRYVAVKTEGQQARAMLFRTRDLWFASARN